MYHIKVTQLRKQLKFFSTNHLAVAQSKAAAWRKKYAQEPEKIISTNFKEK